MSDSIAEKVCTSPHNWLIVTAVTFVLALLILLPQVDELLEARVERAELKAQMESAGQAVEVLPQLETNTVAVAAGLAALKEKVVSEKQVSQLRKWLIDASRQSGCQLRRIDFAPPSRRRWLIEDTPQNQAAAEPAVANNPSLSTPYDLETRSVTLSVTGSRHEIQEILKALDEDPRIKYAQTVDLKPVGRSGKILQLDLTLWYFALVESKQYV